MEWNGRNLKLWLTACSLGMELIFKVLLIKPKLRKSGTQCRTNFWNY